jgi:hypothetical protein
MSNVVALNSNIAPMTNTAIEKVRALEFALAKMPQNHIDTHHVLHAGQYSRTVMLAAGTVVTGALIKIATILIVNGDCTVFLGEETIRVQGYNVLAASAGRKQAFIAHTDTYLTMIFATDAEFIEQAEDQFTDEADLLLSRTEFGHNTILITGE